MPADANPSAAERPTIFPWPPVLLLASALAAWLLGRVAPLAWPGQDDTPARIIGIGFGLAGLALMAWAGVTLRRHRTTILPHARVERLVTDGPFRYRRNPIYLADVMLLLAAAELTKNIWFVILAPFFAALVTWLAILPEERHLEARFGEAYRAYKASTRRWI
jgi:protein-S-isoprenylcysteine O-methyltransferase Ste14